MIRLALSKLKLPKSSKLHLYAVAMGCDGSRLVASVAKLDAARGEVVELPDDGVALFEGDGYLAVGVSLVETDEESAELVALTGDRELEDPLSAAGDIFALIKKARPKKIDGLIFYRAVHLDDDSARRWASKYLRLQDGEVEAWLTIDVTEPAETKKKSRRKKE